MMAPVFLVSSLLQAAAMLPVIALLYVWCRPRRLPLLVLSVGLIVLDQVATGHTEVHSFMTGTQWNWQGKIAAIAVSFSVIAALTRAGWSREEFGLTFRQRPGSLRATSTAVALLVTVQTSISLRAGGRAPWDWESFAFQATMPTVAEELMVRGLLLGVLNRAFTPRRTVLGAALGWGVPLTALVFALSHGLGVSRLPAGAESLVPGWAMTFNAFAFGRTFATGLVYAWLRERSGSLIMPMALHTLVNTASMLARLVL